MPLHFLKIILRQPGVKRFFKKKGSCALMNGIPAP